MGDWPADTRWGVTAAGAISMEGLPGRPHALVDDDAAYDAADAILLLSGDDWGLPRQRRLTESLAKRRRPVLVANPDLVAPRETSVTTEPGTFAHDLLDALPDLEVAFFGKPFVNAFEAVRRRLGTDAPPPEQCLMVGDTLHTDILGGAAAGFHTALVTAHGIYKGLDPEPLMIESGIVPHHRVETT
jgi:ribonucleotide monophosphatase NagD (HAD superfamily)